MSPLPPNIKSLSDYEVGDLIAFQIEGGWVFAVIVERRPTVASWGDSERVVPQNTGVFVRQRDVRPSAGALIGKWFPSLDLVREEAARDLIRKAGAA